VYIRRVETSLYGNDGYAYVALDFDRRNSQFNFLAKPYKGRKSKITPEIEQRIRAEIAVNSDITLEELIEKLNLPIKKSQLSRLLILWGLSFKKRHFTQSGNSEMTSRKSVVNGKKNRKD
jgi:transposase